MYRNIIYSLGLLGIILVTPFIVFAEDNQKKVEPAQVHKSDLDQKIAALQLLDLSAAQQFALANNPTVEAMAARVRSAKEQVKQAASSYWPRLDSEAAYSRVNLSDNAYSSALQTAQLFGATVEDPSESYSAGLNATWILFNGFERKFSNAAANYGVQEKRAAFLESTRLLLDAVAKSYYNSLLARETQIIATANKIYYQKLHKDALARRQAGTGSLSTVLTIEVQVNNAKTQMITAKLGYDTAIVGLAALMGSTVTLPDSLLLAPLENDENSYLKIPARQELITSALKSRPDIQQTNLRVRLAESNENIAKAQLYPKLDLRATYNGNRSNNSDFENDDFGDTISLNLSYNIFAGGLYNSKVSESKHNKMTAQKEYESKTIEVTREINQAIIDIASAQEQLTLQQANMSLVKKNRDLVNKEYEAGQALLVRLNEAQRNLTTFQSVLAQSKVNLNLAWHNLEVATGQNITQTPKTF